MTGSGKAEHGPLLAPAKRQTRMRQQLVGGQIGRLTAVEDGFGDVRGQIAEADEPGEIGWAHPLPLDIDAIDQGGQQVTLSCSGQLGPALADFRGARDQPALC